MRYERLCRHIRTVIAGSKAIHVLRLRVNACVPARVSEYEPVRVYANADRFEPFEPGPTPPPPNMHGQNNMLARACAMLLCFTHARTHGRDRGRVRVRVRSVRTPSREPRVLKAVEGGARRRCGNGCACVLMRAGDSRESTRSHIDRGPSWPWPLAAKRHTRQRHATGARL